MISADTGPMNSSTSSVFDEMLVLLASKYRRRILFDLYDESPRDEDDWHETFAAEIGRAEQVVRAQLQHLHFPKLEDSDVIEWDREWGTVSRGPRFEEVEPFLVMIDDHRGALPADWL